MADGRDFEAANKDPAAQFASPVELVADAGFSDAEKIALLRQWEYDESEIAVATEEGMPGGESALLQQIAAALATLDPAGEETAPTKHRVPPSP